MGSWTLIGQDWELVANKSGPSRMGFALLLKFFDLEARGSLVCLARVSSVR